MIDRNKGTVYEYEIPSGTKYYSNAGSTDQEVVQKLLQRIPGITKISKQVSPTQTIPIWIKS